MEAAETSNSLSVVSRSFEVNWMRLNQSVTAIGKRIAEVQDLTYCVPLCWDPVLEHCCLFVRALAAVRVLQVTIAVSEKPAAHYARAFAYARRLLSACKLQDSGISVSVQRSSDEEYVPVNDACRADLRPLMLENADLEELTNCLEILEYALAKFPCCGEVHLSFTELLLHYQRLSEARFDTRQTQHASSDGIPEINQSTQVDFESSIDHLQNLGRVQSFRDFTERYNDYLANYQSTPDYLGGIRELDFDVFNAPANLTFLGEEVPIIHNPEQRALLSMTSPEADSPWSVTDGPPPPYALSPGIFYHTSIDSRIATHQ